MLQNCGERYKVASSRSVKGVAVQIKKDKARKRKKKKRISKKQVGFKLTHPT